MKTVGKFKSILNSLFTRHLFDTNVVIYGALLGLGDCVVQQANMFVGKQKEYDYPRTGRMITICVVLGPFNHFWYRFLDKALSGTSKRTVMKKIVLDQLIAATFCDVAFLFGLSLLDQYDVEVAKKELKSKFLTVYLVDWAFWPIAQYVNFRYLPSKFRVLYVSMATLVWNCFLSYIKYDVVSEEEDKVSKKE